MQYVSAREAAGLLGVTEKTVRAMIKRGEIDGAIKRSKTLWDIPTSALPVGDKPISSILREYQAQLDDLRQRVTSLESSLRLVARSKAQETPLPPVPVSLPSYNPYTPPVPDAGEPIPAAFATRNAAAKWLGDHGVSWQTARQWLDLPLTPDGALRYALEHKRRAGYRSSSWSLHACYKTGCPCGHILTAGVIASAENDPAPYPSFR